VISIKKKIYYFLKNLFQINNAHEKFMLGSIYLNAAKKNYNLIKNLKDSEYKVFSQTGEDGIIDFLFSKLKIEDCRFVEIGVGDYSEANSRYIYEKSFAKGLIIDVEKNFKEKVSKNINLWKGFLELENTEINSNNINEILDKYNLNENLDLFSIDIDGIDYWVIESLKPRISKIFVLEYNPIFGSNLEITIPNKNKFNRTKSHYTGCYYGASLKAMIKIMKQKGYDFIGTNKLNFNAFFVVEELSYVFKDLKDNLKKLEHYTTLQIRDSRNRNGELNFLDRDQILKEIRDLEVVDVSQNTKKIYKINQIILDI
jgi:hypothetical protein